MGGKKQTVTQKSSPWSAAQPFLKSALGQAEALYKAGDFSATPYSGDRVAGFGDATTGAQQGILDMAAGGAPGTSAARDTMLGMLSGGANPNLAAVKQNALGSAIPAAASMFSGSGMINSSTAMDGVGRAATDAIAPYEYQAYDTAQNRAMQAAQMLPGLDRAMYDPYLMQSQVGAQQDQMAQAEIVAAIKKYYEGEGQAAANFSPYLNAIMGLGGMGGTSSTTSPQQGTGLGPAVMGGLGTYGALAGISGISGGTAGLGGILAALAGLSDRRAKEDIVRIGQTDGGVPLYRFRYKGTEPIHIGVMADEVPWAIKGQINGFDVVDYARIH